MPTYVCQVPPGCLTDDQKSEIARAITHRHSQVTGAPLYFVQVVIEEGVSITRYLGGTLSNGHIWIRGDIRAGRTEEARRQLSLAILEDVARIAAIGRDRIWVYLCNLDPVDMTEYGHTLPAAGREEEWFRSLPAPLQEYLQTLGITAQNFHL